MLKRSERRLMCVLRTLMLWANVSAARFLVNAAAAANLLNRCRGRDKKAVRNCCVSNNLRVRFGRNRSQCGHLFV